MHQDLDRRFLLGGLAGAVGVSALGSMARGGGPLNPPGGAVASTGRTLEQVYDAVTQSAGVPVGYAVVPDDVNELTVGNRECILVGSRSWSGAGSMLSISAPYLTVDFNGQKWIMNTPTQPVINVTGDQTTLVLRNGTLVGGNSGIFISGAVNHVVIQNMTFIGQRTAAVVASSAAARRITIENCDVITPGAATSAADGNMNISGILLGGAQHSVRNCRVRGFAYNGSGTPTFRGVWFNTSVVNGGVGNELSGCTVSGENVPNGGSIGIQFAGAGVYRNNTVMGFPTTSYAFGGTVLNGGGNV